jgi:hypothetical protein
MDARQSLTRQESSPCLFYKRDARLFRRRIKLDADCDGRSGSNFQQGVASRIGKRSDAVKASAETSQYDWTYVDRGPARVIVFGVRYIRHQPPNLLALTIWTTSASISLERFVRRR